MNAIFAKFFKLGLDRRFGYKVATGHGDICIFRYHEDGLWQNLVMNSPHLYLESEVITILAHCAKTGDFKPFACCCMKCAKLTTPAMLADFEAKYCERINHTYWPDCAAAEHARFE